MRHALPAGAVAALLADFRRRGMPYLLADQTGWLKHGTRRREIVEWFFSLSFFNNPPNSVKGAIS